jgi:hypothetical protein
MQLHKETDNLNFEELYAHLSKACHPNELINVYEFANKEYTYAVLKNIDY